MKIIENECLDKYHFESFPFYTIGEKLTLVLYFMDLIIAYLKNAELLETKTEARVLRLKALAMSSTTISSIGGVTLCHS